MEIVCLPFSENARKFLSDGHYYCIQDLIDLVKFGCLNKTLSALYDTDKIINEIKEVLEYNEISIEGN